MVVAKVVNGQIKLVSNKVFDVSTTPDIGSNYHRNDRAVVPDGMIEKFRANSRGYKTPGTIAFDMVDSGWDRIQRVLAGSGAYNRLDETDNPTCIFHTGGSNTAGGQGCIVFKPEDQETIKNLLASSQGGEFNKLVLDSGKQTLNTVA
ncbi:MAG: hypothetical protein HRT47_07780 [Candidatus Caenarcaniphilales bacterium]|nr:hypothetical protein [Candidatus Caenarcaniphilales bacterium]